MIGSENRLSATGLIEMIPSQNLTMYVDKKSGTFLPSPPGGKGLGEGDFFLFSQMKSHLAIRQKLLSTYTQRFLVCLAIILISCAVVIPASGSSVNVPLDHWSYRDIDSLIGFGLIQNAIAVGSTYNTSSPNTGKGWLVLLWNRSRILI